MIIDNPNGFQRPIEDTQENIFPSENPKKPIKVKRNEKILKRRKVYAQYFGDNIGGIINSNNINDDGLEKKMPSKPCNNDYNLVNEEAKKNANVRYYFENNTSQWGYI